MQLYVIKTNSGLSKPYSSRDEVDAFLEVFTSAGAKPPEVIEVAIPDEMLLSGQHEVTATVAVA